MDSDIPVLIVWAIVCIIILASAMIGKWNRKATVGLTIAATVVMLVILSVVHLANSMTTLLLDSNVDNNATVPMLLGIVLSVLLGTTCTIVALAVSGIFSDNDRDR